ncbi:MAG: DUF3099 domain-containing protein [Actinomycetota bacterium]|nr:DUF3099 domain-containing protein [Actinomycetota bacterium]
MRRRTRGQPQPVYQITGARRGVSEDVSARQRRYLASMSVRTACFVLAIVTSGWWQGAFLVGAIVLPYVSVVFANAGRERAPDLPAVPSAPAVRALPSPRSQRPS